MRIVLPRRAVIALISGLLTLAVVAAVTLSLNLRQPRNSARSNSATPQVTVTYTVYSTATPTSTAPSASATPSGRTPTGSGKSSGSTATPPPIPTKGRVPGSSTGGGVTPTPAPTPTGSPVWTPPSTGTATPTAAPPTPTSTPASPVDGATVTGSYNVNTSYSAGISATVVMSNTGTTTWLGDWSYYLGCVSNCMNASSSPAQGITPGNSQAFSLQLFPPTPFTTATYYSKWSMVHSGTLFGAVATVKIVVTLAVPLGVDPAPGCDSSSMSWSLAGGATCANGGLSLTTNSAQEPEAMLQTGPSGFNDANYYFTVDAAYSTTATAWVRLMSYFAYGSQSASSRCYAQGFDVQPNGTYRIFYIANCKETDGLWYTKSVPSGSTITVTIQLTSGYEQVWINHGGLENGGSLFTSGYPMVTVGGSDGVTVTVTNAELDTPVTPYRQWYVMP